MGPEYDDTDFHVAAHHWAPLLIRRNYEGSKGTRVSRQFKTLLTKLEATSCCCSIMEEPINNFESCMKRAGISIPKMDKRRLLLAQGPTNTLSSVRSYFEGISGESYFEGISGERAVGLRQRIREDENREALAVPEAVSSASPLVSSLAPPICILSNPRGRKPRTIGSSRGSGIGVSTSILPCPPICILSWPNSLGLHLPKIHKR
jgi:hypothetical protein